ncbi:glycerate kinase [Pseudonocardia sp. GCM10023141]|uniref:glycerate kinase n=1 Tax=Pseudonocardia sp. GCM10023141 TaxID=3252653 RepID=UPI0036208BEF
MTGHVVLAPDKFKGSIPASRVAAHLRTGLLAALPGLAVVAVPVADGGDGTLDAAVSAGFTLVPVVASGPTGQPVRTGYARRDGVAVIELADVSGLGRLVGGRPAPLTASSRGTGEVLAAALDTGCTRIVLGIGGSAGTDGGAGIVVALGGRLLDAAGRDIGDGGSALGAVADLDLSRLHPGLRTAEIVVACDVDNPLLGPTGAAAVYGPQKGADTGEVEELDAALGRWSAVVAATTGHDRASCPGAGAAGGVGFAALAVLGAVLQPGIDLVLDMVGFPRHLAGARLVITGEGSLDAQTLRGKAPAGVAAAARVAGVPVIAAAGRNALSDADLAASGIQGAYALTDIEADPARCMEHAGPLLERLAHRIARDHLAAVPDALSDML